jgi:hypothetical protein
MASYHMIRSWCQFPCRTWTAHRRFDRVDAPSAKVECAEHNLPIRRVDWVDLAVKLANEHAQHDD